MWIGAGLACLVGGCGGASERAPAGEARAEESGAPTTSGAEPAVGVGRRAPVPVVADLDVVGPWGTVCSLHADGSVVVDGQVIGTDDARALW